MVVPKEEEVVRVLWVLRDNLLVAVQVQVALEPDMQIQEATTLSLLLDDDDVPLMHSVDYIHTSLYF